jgi:hypothetical protein
MTDQPESRPLQDHELIEQAVDLAIKKTFAILGVDIEKPESVEEFREDLRFGRKLRRMSDHGNFVMVAGVIAGLIYALWYGIKAAAGIKS